MHDPTCIFWTNLIPFSLAGLDLRERRLDGGQHAGGARESRARGSDRADLEPGGARRAEAVLRHRRDHRDLDFTIYNAMAPSPDPAAVAT